MAFPTILVNCVTQAALPNLLAVAEAMALPARTHILGFVVVPDLAAGATAMQETHAASGPLSSDLGDARAQQMRTQFERAMAGKPFSRDWTSVRASPTRLIDSILMHGRLADLIITSADQSQRHGVPVSDDNERLIMAAGRPVLLVPRRMQQSTCGRRVLVAWNDSRESTRALFDALPVLRTAEYVKLLRLGADSPSENVNITCTALGQALARQGIEATAEDLTMPRASVGAALLSATKAEDADLLVMGGYGHWRNSEMVLGSATRHVLKNMALPVLMSH